VCIDTYLALRLLFCFVLFCFFVFINRFDPFQLFCVPPLVSVPGVVVWCGVGSQSWRVIRMHREEDRTRQTA